MSIDDSSQSDDSISIYINESRELLQDVESTLLSLESDPNDSELIDQLFRSIHTIKGSAGLFGLDEIIAFTHIVENILDNMRNGEIVSDRKLISLLIDCSDHITHMLDTLENSTDVDGAKSKQLIQALSLYKPTNFCDTAVQYEEESRVESETVSEEVKRYHIAIHCDQDMLKDGFDPQSRFIALQESGVIENSILIDRLPNFEEYDPLSCYFVWELSYKTQASKNEILEIFDFFNASVQIHSEKDSIDKFKNYLSGLPKDIQSQCENALFEFGFVSNKNLPQTQESYKIEQKQKDKKSLRTALSGTTFIKVDSIKLDRLVNLVGTMITVSSKVRQMIKEKGDEAQFESIQELVSALEDTRETTLNLRMVSIGDTFNRFRRVVRDTSKELNKAISLEVYGSDTELDKTIIEKIGDPLTHLMRNAIDHGIESVEERVSAGKPKEGLIRLDAYHKTGAIVIEIKDDGKGLDRDKIFSLAEKKGLVTASDRSMSDSEVYQLIFQPGFSTSDKISNISGRGVGMDVVKRNIESIRGYVEIDTTPGKGTTFFIYLPLTLAIIDGFHVGLMQESFILPLDMVVECITLTEDQCEEMKKNQFISLRQEVLPIVGLSDYFGLSVKKIDPTARINVVVVSYADNKVGFLVDELYGETQVVIKPLGHVFEGLNAFSGFTLIGSGSVALVVDVPGIVKETIQNSHVKKTATVKLAS